MRDQDAISARVDELCTYIRKLGSTAYLSASTRDFTVGQLTALLWVLDSERTNLQARHLADLIWSARGLRVDL
jgi:hypothetical protein